jgi:spore germination protein
MIMNTMKNKFIIPILTLALVAACGWGYSQYQTKRQYEINMENQYQRAFEDLTNHVGNMETAMSKALVASSFPQAIRLLTGAWREANSCQSNLGQLPLTSMELSRFKMLFAESSAFCFNSIQNRLLKGTAADEKEWGALRGLRDRTQIVSRHLNNLRTQFYSSRARWLQVDRLGAVGASGIAAGLNTNKVTKSFLMLEDGLKRVPDVQFEGNNLDFVPKPTGLSGGNISARDAVAVARRYVSPEIKGVKVKYEGLTKGELPSYMFSCSDPRQPDNIRNLSISVKGGHVLWMLGNRTVRNSGLKPDQIQEKALNFLRRNGYGGMRQVALERFGNVASVTCVPQRNGILRYPELIKVQVAQDNGEILGVDAVPYLTFYNPAEPPLMKPRYAESRLKPLLNRHVKMEGMRLAQVLDEMYNKVLCYEVSCMEGENRFLIYYNANTGQEEKIRRVDRYGNEIL